jgi:hypothetical protein
VKVKLKKVLLRVILARLCAVVIMLSLTTLGGISLLATSAWAHDVTPHPHAEDSKAADEYKHPQHGSLGDVGAKLANPLASLWSLSFDYQPLRFFDGDLNEGDSRLGAGVTFQPVLPIPLYGEGDTQWRLITRPVIPIQFSQPILRRYDKFYNKGGLGDIQLPVMLALPEKYTGHWILGAGPVGLFPTATDDALGSDQFALGPAVVFGYKTKLFTAVLFPNYFWKIGSHDQDRNTPDISRGSLLYALTFNLPQAWQAGFHPTITYDEKASSGNKWNVPVGLFVGKTIKVGNTPLNLKFGLEYSVVSQDDFGKRTVFRIEITPVIPSLIKNPIFGK